MNILKPSELQFSCTCLQYSFDAEKLDDLISNLRKRGFKVRKERAKGKKDAEYSVERAVEAYFNKSGASKKHSKDSGEYCLSYNSDEDNCRISEDFEKALDCLRLSFVASDLDAGASMNFGEPVRQKLEIGSAFVFHDRPAEEYHWIFADITDKCNLSCDFCYKPEHLNESIGIGGFRNALREFKKENKKTRWNNPSLGVTLGGGEPTLHPKLERILEIANVQYDFVTLTTNGTNPELFSRIGKYLDGVCISAPFVYNNNPKFSYGVSREQTEKAVKSIAENVKKVCVSTIVTNEMNPNDVFRFAEFAKSAGATDLLFLMYKPGDSGLVPSREHARKILEKVLEVDYKIMPASIDSCFAARTVWQKCYGLPYSGVDGILKTGYCPFLPDKKDCAFVKK